VTASHGREGLTVKNWKTGTGTEKTATTPDGDPGVIAEAQSHHVAEREGLSSLEALGDRSSVASAASGIYDPLCLGPGM
jgi:hypothetical protein